MFVRNAPCNLPNETTYVVLYYGTTKDKEKTFCCCSMTLIGLIWIKQFHSPLRNLRRNTLLSAVLAEIILRFCHAIAIMLYITLLCGI